MHERVRLPGAVLSAAVDVSPVIQKVLDYGEPAAGACLVERAVTGVISVIHLTHSVLQTVQHNLLKKKKKKSQQREQGLVCEHLRSKHCESSHTSQMHAQTVLPFTVPEGEK